MGHLRKTAQSNAVLFIHFTKPMYRGYMLADFVPEGPMTSHETFSQEIPNFGESEMLIFDEIFGSGRLACAVECLPLETGGALISVSSSLEAKDFNNAIMFVENAFVFHQR
jgi:hypothetical protein